MIGADEHVKSMLGWLTAKGGTTTPHRPDVMDYLLRGVAHTGARQIIPGLSKTLSTSIFSTGYQDMLDGRGLMPGVRALCCEHRYLVVTRQVGCRPCEMRTGAGFRRVPLVYFRRTPFRDEGSLPSMTWTSAKPYPSCCAGTAAR